MDKYTRLRNGKLVGRGIANAISTLPPSDGYSSDESEEYEFDWEPSSGFTIRQGWEIGWLRV